MKQMPNRRWLYALCFAGLFLLEIGIALHVHDDFVRPYVGDMLAVVLVYCLARVFVNHPHRLLPLYVFLFACTIELAQYVGVADRLDLQNRALRIALGSVADWGDVASYAAGCLALCFVRK